MLPLYCPIPDWFRIGRGPGGYLCWCTCNRAMVDESDIATSENGGTRRVLPSKFATEQCLESPQCATLGDDAHVDDQCIP